MNPTALAVVLGIAAALAYKFFVADAGSDSFVVQGGSRFWKKELAPQLKAALSKLRASPHPAVERVWTLGTVGAEPALARVAAIQNAGHFAVSTDNLLSNLAGAPGTGLSEVLPTETATLAPVGGSVAVLPVIQ